MDARVLVISGPDDSYQVHRQDALLADQEAALQERRMQVRHEHDEKFSAVLIDLDGIEKKRWTGPVDPREIYAIVDEMPMRQQEMREQT
jgi:Domain of unknown function (DUF4174)